MTNKDYHSIFTKKLAFFKKNNDFLLYMIICNIYFDNFKFSEKLQ